MNETNTIESNHIQLKLKLEKQLAQIPPLLPLPMYVASNFLILLPFVFRIREIDR